MNIREAIPAPIKLQISLFRRGIHDIFQRSKFARQKFSNVGFSYSLLRRQKIKQTGTSTAKKNNLIQAARLIESIQINPQEIFSFWKIVGKPTTKRGFEEGRTIVNGTLEPSVGGGLCQLAGLIYYICLEGNLEIIERHNHSVDIYTEETRYTPLGSDAAVVYGYKDLRVINNFNFPINFSFSVSESNIDVSINSTKKIEKSKVEFESRPISNNQVEALTRVQGIVKEKSTYRQDSSAE